MIPLNCHSIIAVVCLLAWWHASAFLRFLFHEYLLSPHQCQVQSWALGTQGCLRHKCSVCPCSAALLLYWSVATFLKDRQCLGWTLTNIVILHLTQNKTTKKLAMLTQFSYATMWEKCPKTEAVKIKLPAIWPLAHQGQHSLCLVSSDNCCDPVLTDKPHLAHYHFLNDAIWKGQTRFSEEGEQGWG